MPRTAFHLEQSAVFFIIWDTCMKVFDIGLKLVHWLPRVLSPRILSTLAVILVIGSLVGVGILLPAIIARDAGRGVSLLLPGDGRNAAQDEPPTRYVDAQAGADANPGTSKQPWKTIQKAADWAANAASGSGATIHVRPGTYPERVHVRGGGTAAAHVTFQGHGRAVTRGFTLRADYVTIRGFEITNTRNVWDDGAGIFIEASHCLVENNYVHFATRGGIILFGNQGEEGPTTNCTIKNNRLYRNALVGIEVRGRDHVIEANEIWGTIQYHPLWLNPPNWVDADGIRFFGSGHVIRDNYIHHITFADPENVDPHIDCFQTWGPAHNIGFHRNRCTVLEVQSRSERGKGFMIEEQYGPVRDLTITNNIIQAFNHVTAIDAENVTILNNTFVGDPTFPAWALGAVEFFRSPGATVQNNVFYNLQNEHIAADEASMQGWKVSHNAVYRADGRTPPGTARTGDVWNVDPLFRDPAGNDFRLRPGSPLIDAGASVGVPRDVTGQTRPQGKAHDIGAYEYRGERQPAPAASPTPSPTRTPTPTPSPTPSPTRIPTDDTPSPVPTASPTPTPSPTRAPTTATAPATESPTPSPTRTSSPGTPAPPRPTASSTPTPSSTPLPSPTPTPSPAPSPTPTLLFRPPPTPWSMPIPYSE
jgi:hypothetical protein